MIASPHQVFDETIKEVLPYPLQGLGPQCRLPAVPRLIQLDALPDLLEELNDLLTSFLLHGSLHEGSYHLIVDLYT